MVMYVMLLQLLAAAVVALFIYLHIKQVDFVSAVLGTDMVIAASFLIIVSGCLLLLVAIFGLIVAIVNRTKPLAVVSCTSW